MAWYLAALSPEQCQQLIGPSMVRPSGGWPCEQRQARKLLAKDLQRHKLANADLPICFGFWRAEMRAPEPISEPGKGHQPWRWEMRHSLLRFGSKLEGRSRGPIIPGSEGESLVEERKTLRSSWFRGLTALSDFWLPCSGAHVFLLSFAKMSVCGICNTL